MDNIDTQRLFRFFYRRNKKSCGESCCFYDSYNKKLDYSFRKAMVFQFRIMRFLYESGYRFKIYRMFFLNKKICENAHEACKTNNDDFFSVTNLYADDSPERDKNWKTIINNMEL